MRKFPDIGKIWNALRKSARFHNLLVFLGFVAIATVFWFVMAMNDSVQKDVTVRISVDNVPDSVTFITDPPASFHVAVRDRGSQLLRVAGLRTPAIHINFRDYASDDLLRVAPSDFKAALKATFGKTASILTSSMDSLRLSYTTAPGRSLPVLVVATCEAAPGSIVVGKPKASPARVTVFGPQSILDTMTRILTEPVAMRSLKEPTSVRASLTDVPGVRIKPAAVDIKVAVEPLVRKEVTVSIKPINVPHGITLMLFPAKVNVAYYVPMSRFGEEQKAIDVMVDYNSVARSRGVKLPIYIGGVPGGIVRPELTVDSVEYSVVR